MDGHKEQCEIVYYLYTSGSVRVSGAWVKIICYRPICGGSRNMD